MAPTTGKPVPFGRVPLKADVGEEFYQHTLTRKRFDHCLVEAFKNGLDWGATLIRLYTADTNQLRYVDNGVGMNAENRHAFVSLALTTAKSHRQSARFGSGIKHLIFSHSSFVRVVTAPEEDPEAVYIFEFSPEDLQKSYAQKGLDLGAQRVVKTAEVWSHDHLFGTDITVTYRNPRDKKLMRGDRLARMLANQLDTVMASIITVDGNPLPEKEVEGEIFQVDLPDGAVPGLGRVRLEFWRPKYVERETRLWMTDRTFGEVDFRGEFISLLLTEQQQRVPELFRRPEVCGLVTAHYLNGFVMETRDTYDPSVAYDERTNVLLRLLRQYQSDVAQKLRIKLLDRSPSEDTTEVEVQDVIELLANKYGPAPGPGDDTIIREDDDEGVTDHPVRTVSDAPRITLNHQLTAGSEQYEVGEIIEATLTVPKGDPKDFVWRVDQSRADVIDEDRPRGKIRLRAREIGRGLVFAVNAQGAQRVESEYEILSHRHFCLVTPLRVKVGSRVTVRAVNHDKADGGVVWETAVEGNNGVITARSRGTSATYIPARPGTVQVTAWEVNNPTNRQYSTITVTREHEAVYVRIRDEVFRRDRLPLSEGRHNRPVIIHAMGPKGCNEVHTIIFNPEAPGWREAQQSGTLQPFLIHCLAAEYWAQFELDTGNVTTNRDVEAMLQNLADGTCQVFGEIVVSQKKQR